MFKRIYRKEYKILKKYTRVIDSIEIKFYIVKVSYHLFGSMFCYSIKKLFKNRVLEMKDYLHRKFMKFYYNGIFIEMQRKNEGAKDNKKIVITL